MSVHPILRRSLGVRRVCCCGPGGREISIDSGWRPAAAAPQDGPQQPRKPDGRGCCDCDGRSSASSTIQRRRGGGRRQLPQPVCVSGGSPQRTGDAGSGPGEGRTLQLGARAVLTNGHTGHVPRAPGFFFFLRAPNWLCSKLESDVCCHLQVAPPGERYGGNRRPGRKQRQTTAE